MVRVVLLFVLVVLAVASEGAKWKYGETDETGYGPKDWGKVSPDCDKSAQSPINIETNSVIKVGNGKALKLTCDKSGYVSGNIVNNGHAPTLYIDKAKGTCQLSGGPLGYSKYKLEQLHFHFGCEDGEGSEHTVDGDAYSGELHLVTYNTDYRNFATAADKTDGLSVIGVFLQKEDDVDDGHSSYSALRMLANAMSRIREKEFEGKRYCIQDMEQYEYVRGDQQCICIYGRGAELCHYTTLDCENNVGFIV